MLAADDDAADDDAAAGSGVLCGVAGPGPDVGSEHPPARTSEARAVANAACDRTRAVTTIECAPTCWQRATPAPRSRHLG
jgi:hypothetical protein